MDASSANSGSSLELVKFQPLICLVLQQLDTKIQPNIGVEVNERKLEDYQSKMINKTL